MLENDNLNLNYKINRPLVMRALRRSNIRKKIVEECTADNNIKLYRLTSFGTEIIKNINKDKIQD